eukprot:CAMPEP_0177757704 /NCGR_PEP_ID=MMETSP0491_2-20121128/3785_1 /TAXON_ID=63592 /ORGANISM="Tetraselmis chuii, Strain PLY429" /LENGTH=205 /DNA_ID=CAMNT_0019273373 /DNA_START=771 /DNA_END=1389 /DNA_ORIENTATION=-
MSEVHRGGFVDSKHGAVRVYVGAILAEIQCPTVPNNGTGPQVLCPPDVLLGAGQVVRHLVPRLLPYGPVASHLFAALGEEQLLGAKTFWWLSGKLVTGGTSSRHESPNLCDKRKLPESGAPFSAVRDDDTAAESLIRVLARAGSLEGSVSTELGMSGCARVSSSAEQSAHSAGSARAIRPAMRFADCVEAGPPNLNRTVNEKNGP